MFRYSDPWKKRIVEHLISIYKHIVVSGNGRICHTLLTAPWSCTHYGRRHPHPRILGGLRPPAPEPAPPTAVRRPTQPSPAYVGTARASPGQAGPAWPRHRPGTARRQWRPPKPGAEAAAPRLPSQALATVGPFSLHASRHRRRVRWKRRLEDVRRGDLALAPCRRRGIHGGLPFGGIRRVLWRCRCHPLLPDYRLPSPFLSTVRTPHCAPSCGLMGQSEEARGIGFLGMVLRRGGRVGLVVAALARGRGRAAARMG